MLTRAALQKEPPVSSLLGFFPRFSYQLGYTNAMEVPYLRARAAISRVRVPHHFDLTSAYASAWQRASSPHRDPWMVSHCCMCGHPPHSPSLCTQPASARLTWVRGMCGLSFITQRAATPATPVCVQGELKSDSPSTGSLSNLRRPSSARYRSAGSYRLRQG